MILLMLQLLWAAPVDIERARVALEQGDPVLAVEHSRVAVSEEPVNWRAQQVYAESLAAAGLTHRINAELGAIADLDDAVKVVLAWHEARTATSSATAMAAISQAGESEQELASLALGSLALEGGNAAVALSVLENSTLPEALSIRLAAAMAQADDRAAAGLAKTLMDIHPGRLDLLSPLFGRGEVSGAIRRSRTKVVKAAHALGTTSEDAAEVYRARTVLVAAGDGDRAADVVERLGRLGEAGVPNRRGYSPAMRRGMARGLAMQRTPELPDGPADEVRDIGISVALTLRDLGRIPDALNVWEALRERADDSELAVAHARQVLRTGRGEQAIGIAHEAIEMATMPWQHELATAYAVLAEALLSGERPDEALEPAVLASLLAPTAEHMQLRAVVFQTLGQREAGWTSLAAADALGARVQGTLEANYPGVGFWADASRDAAQRWSDTSDAELPQMDANDLPERPERPIVDAPFPEWHAAASDFGSSDIEGQVTVITFWASWCGPCKVELPMLDSMAEDWSDLGITVVALSVDDNRRAMDRYLSRHPLENIVPVYGPEVGSRLGIGSLPTTWVIDREGIARIFHQGYGEGSAEQLDTEVRQLAR
jgi:thiol-disulfide isomerase/thioredoxin